MQLYCTLKVRLIYQILRSISKTGEILHKKNRSILFFTNREYAQEIDGKQSKTSKENKKRVSDVQSRVTKSKKYKKNQKKNQLVSRFQAVFSLLLP